MTTFELVIGGPGTGKTEYLIRTIEAELKRGVRPDQVAFVSFTKAATEEAQSRAATAFKRSARDFPYFRTLHSLCFRQLGLRRGDVLAGKALRELEDLTGESEQRDVLDNEAGPWEIEQLARATFQDGEALAKEFGLDVHRYRRAVGARAKFKEDRDLLDFTDMLSRYVEVGLPLSSLALAIVDEAQDLTPLQWMVVRRAFSSAGRLIVAGDDDQAIHEWAGSTIKPLLEHTGKREVLTVSYRLPRSVHQLAAASLRSLSGRRIPKDVAPAARDGLVEWYARAEEVPLAETPGSWLLLVRAKYQLQEAAQLAREAGVPYTLRGKSSVNTELLEAAVAYERANSAAPVRWHDALTQFPIEEREYLLACRRQGEKLNVPPRVTIETVHGAKGKQADNVMLLTDLTYRVAQRADEDPDPEQRVLYVALTRASHTLHLVQPKARYAWQI